jgi:hypothetical protein
MAIKSGLNLLVSMFFYQLTDGLVAVVLEVGVIAEDLVRYVLGNLLVHTCHGFLLGGGHLVPLRPLLLSL